MKYHSILEQIMEFNRDFKDPKRTGKASGKAGQKKLNA